MKNILKYINILNYILIIYIMSNPAYKFINNTNQIYLDTADENKLKITNESTDVVEIGATFFNVTGNVDITSNLTVDTNDLYVDTSGGRVGIGRVPTTNRLEVNGNIDVQSLGGFFAISGTNVLNATTLGSGILNSSLTSVGTLSSLAVTGDLTVDTDTLFVDSSEDQVGINTTTLQSTSVLSVLNNSNNDNALHLITPLSAIGQNTGILFSIPATTDSQARIFFNSLSGNKSELHFQTQTAADSLVTALTIDEDGNVGIGVTNPDSLLHLSSGTSGDCVLILEADTDNNNEDDNPYIVFKQDGGIEESAIGHIDASQKNALVIANSIADGAIAFKTGSTNGYTNATQSMYIDSSGIIGIGTTDPKSGLDIHSNTLEESNTRNMLKIRSTGGDTNLRFCRLGTLEDETMVITKNYYRTGAGFIVENSSYGSQFINLDEDGDIDFATQSAGSGNPATRLTLSKNGDVSIGTSGFNFYKDTGIVALQTSSSPTQIDNTTLSMGPFLGKTKLALWDGGAGSAIGMGIQGGELGFFVDNSGNKYGFYDDENWTNNLMTILGTGNVGIGITNPDALLHINSSISNLKTTDVNGLLVSHSTDARLQLASNESGNYASRIVLSNCVSASENHHWFLSQGTGSESDRLDIGYYTSANLTDENIGGTIGSKYMSFATDGDIGIGTTEPDEHLHIVGSGSQFLKVETTDNGIAQVQFSTTDEGDSFIGPTADTFDVFTYGAKDIIIGTSGIEKIRVETSGDVGIGTASTNNNKLIISGSGGTRDVSSHSNCILYLHETSDECFQFIESTGTGNDCGIVFYSPTTDSGIFHNATDNHLALSIGSQDGSTNRRNNTKMVIDTTGNVGIGITDPDQHLHIEGSGDQFFKLESTGDNSTQIQFTSTDGDSFIGPTATNFDFFENAGGKDMRFSTSGLLRMTIASGGAVSIVGNLSKGSGSFKIPHPDPVKREEKKWLKHCFVESNNAGDNIYRYSITTSEDNESYTIDLPDYFKHLNENVQCWITPVGQFAQSYVEYKDDEKVTVKCEKQGEYEVLIIGTRKDPIAVTNFDGCEPDVTEKEEDTFNQMLQFY
jgi:hypothetical protein